MKNYLKTPYKKFKTKIDFLAKNENISIKGNNIFYKSEKIFYFDKKEVVYDKLRIFSSQKEEFFEDKFGVKIILDHENLKIFNSNIINPPKGANVIYIYFKDFLGPIDEIIIGAEINNFEEGILNITRDLYYTVLEINKEEKKDKNVRIKNRLIPFFKNIFKLDNISESINEINYKLALKEVIASGQIQDEDIISLTNQLGVGESSKMVITQEINKQTEWLLDILREIIDIPKLTREKACEFGKKYFGYAKKSIQGPEHLMEKILTDYGKSVIFGAPALLNTDKYVLSPKLPRVQFDIILIDTLSDVEIVELKRPDVFVLDYESGRNKFYPSKDLSIAIGQTERYITTLYKDNDPDFVIGDKSVREYIEQEVGGSIELSITRPTALIVIGRINKICKQYEDVKFKKGKKISRKEYYDNVEKAYRELRNTHKNIKIMTYSELVENAELRLKSN